MTGKKGQSSETRCATGEYVRRAKRLREKVCRARLDALIVVTPVNRRYITGFSSSNGVLLVLPDKNPVFLTDFRYLEMARKDIVGCVVRPLESLAKDLPSISRGRWKTVGFEGMVSVAMLERMQAALPEAKDWQRSGHLLAELRSVKSRCEQAALRRAVALGDAVYLNTIAEVRPGMTEWDIRRVLRGHLDRLDAEGESFDCIVSIGSNASKPHAQVTGKILRKNQSLLIDMGVRLGGYCSDLTRCAFTGPPSPKMAEIYQVVLDAQQAALAKVAAGITGREVDRVARRVIERAGYGVYFGHGLGHGVGLEIHEEPRLGKQSDTVLKPGMVVTIEPGIYLPGVGGVRIEDMIIVRSKGCENLTTVPKDTIRLDA